MAFSWHIKTIQNDIEFLNRINSILDHYLTTYENIILIGDFNLCVGNTYLEATLENYDLNNLINMPTCYQSNNPTCIDLILTSKKNLFKLSDTFETGLSDHHKLISTILKSGGFKGRPKEKIYNRIGNLTPKVLKKIWNLEFRLNHLTSSSYDFETTLLKELNRHAPLKEKILLHNYNRFMPKDERVEKSNNASIKTQKHF